MDAQQFAYWLQGYAELTTDAPTAEQWKAIKEHLQTVFVKVTPLAPEDVAPWPALPATGQRPWWLNQPQCSTIPGNDAQSYC